MVSGLAEIVDIWASKWNCEFNSDGTLKVTGCYADTFEGDFVGAYSVADQYFRNYGSNVKVKYVKIR